MGDWANLRTCADEPRSPSQVDAAPVLLCAKYYVPTLWPALFAPGDVRGAPPRRFWFQTPLADAVARLRGLSAQLAQDPRFADLWGAAEPTARWIEDRRPSGRLILDAREIAKMVEQPRSFRAELAKAAEDYATLASAWSQPIAVGLLPPWLQGSDATSDATAVRRWTRANNSRTAFFMLAFGWPADEGALGERWQSWFDAEPPGPPLPDPATEAARLRERLAQRGLVVFSERPSDERWIAQFLGVALRERTPRALAEMLDVMKAQGMVRELRGSAAELQDVLRGLDQP
jgi:hypothetical protein